MACYRSSRHPLTLSLLIACLLGFPFPTSAEDVPSLPYEDAAAKDQSDWSEVLSQGDFAALDKIADDLRAQNSKYRNGRGRLWRFVSVGLAAKPSEMKNEAYDASIKRIDAWLEANPKSINARLTLANHWIKYAQWARAVEADANDPSKTIAGRLEKAEQYLDEIDSLTKDVDNVYRRLRIEHTKISGKKPDVALVYEGLKVDPTNMELVHGMATCLLPRWYGEEGEVEKFADEVVTRTKDKCGELQYVVAAIATKELLKSYLLETHQFSWPRLKQGFRDIERLYPQASDFLNDEAQLAFMAGDLDSLYGLVSRIGDKPLQSSWKEAEISFQGLRQRINPEMLRGDQQKLLLGHVAAVIAVGTIGDDKVAVSVNWDFGIRMHDVATGERRGWAWRRGIYAQSANIHPLTALFASGSEYDPGVMLESFANGQSGGLTPSAAKVKQTAFSPKGDLLAAADEPGLVVVFDLNSGKVKHKFSAKAKRKIMGLAFSTKATKLAAICDSGELLVFNLMTDKLEATHKIAGQSMRSVAWSDLHLAAGTAAGEVHLLNGETGTEVSTWKADPLEIASLAFSPDGEKLAIGIRAGKRDTPVPQPLFVWNHRTEKHPQPLQGHKLGVNCVRFLDQGKKLISASNDWTVRTWNIAP